jgi:hypothetical protein
MFTGCEVKDGAITSAQIFTKGGFYQLNAKVFIDASADADVAHYAGVPTTFGRESDNLAQPMTLNFHVYDVDRDKLCDYVENNLDDMFRMTPRKIRPLKRYDISGAFSKINAAKAAGEFVYNKNRDTVLCFETSNDGEYVVDMTRISMKSAVDAFDLTEAEILGRKQVHETFHFLKKYIPGFENCKLAYSGPNIGIRESRKINGVYKLTVDDLTNNVMFPDAVTMGGYPIDVHSPDGDGFCHCVGCCGSRRFLLHRSVLRQTVLRVLCFREGDCPWEDGCCRFVCLFRRDRGRCRRVHRDARWRVCPHGFHCARVPQPVHGFHCARVFRKEHYCRIAADGWRDFHRRAPETVDGWCCPQQVCAEQYPYCRFCVCDYYDKDVFSFAVLGFADPLGTSLLDGFMSGSCLYGAPAP